MTEAATRLLLVGASVRAAAQSARRAGFACQACDLFGDADLAPCCQTATIEDYPRGFLAAVAGTDGDGWLYTGGLENYPRLVDRMARIKPLWGNRGDALRRVRDPAVLSELLAKKGLAYPEWRASAQGLPTDGSWLCKGRRSSGGLQVTRWIGNSTTRPANACYFQRYIAGTSGSAVYVAARGKCCWLGASRQLLDGGWSGAESFRYAGSVAPLDIHRDLQDMLATIGEVLAGEFQLAGLFGVDFVLADETVWPVEVNPRLPASVETLERVSGFNAVACHIAACCAGELPSPPRAQGAAGKAIVYARQSLQVSAKTSHTLLETNVSTAWPIVADIPRGGTTIDAGMPIATVFAQAARVEGIEEALRAKQAWLEGMLYERADD
ncbi:MAG: ATP-grasp domain-containing protein [Pirellulales bacterium]|nr:ATP-grasp domain-containing protein [Pirellulales bacterium]